MQPQPIRLPHSGLTVPHDRYTVTAYKERRTPDGVAFTATLRANGTIIGTIENEGTGGPDTFYSKSTSGGRHADQVNALEAFAGACTSAHGTTPALEFVLSDLVTEYQTGRDIARAAKRGNTLLRLMQDYETDDGPMGWPDETDVLEVPVSALANRGRLRAHLLCHRKLAPPALGWWQIWEAGQNRWTDLTDRPAHIPADRY